MKRWVFNPSLSCPRLLEVEHVDVGSEFQATWVRRGSFTGRVECWTDEPSCRDVQLNGYILPDIVPQGTIGLGLVQLEPVCQMDPEREFPNIVQKRKLQYLSHRGSEYLYKCFFSRQL